MAGKRNIVLAIALLGLGIVGGAFAGVSTGSKVGAGSTQVNVSVLEGKLTVSATTLPTGTITLVVVNKGKLTHGIAIMGTGLSPKQTPTLAIGKTARLTVTLKAGTYHIWDPVRSSMSHAKVLTVKAPKASSGGSGSGGSSGGYVVTGSGSGSGGSGGTGGAPMGDDMEGMGH